MCYFGKDTHCTAGQKPKMGLHIQSMGILHDSVTPVALPPGILSGRESRANSLRQAAVKNISQ
jgi:hypothetical protein